ncbi:ribosome-recycling factor, mitochondrial [Anoplophora glabripennis]|nr:ribosome-recycling factor, mitochondrial [Anoplophora glabripennis]
MISRTFINSCKFIKRSSSIIPLRTITANVSAVNSQYSTLIPSIQTLCEPPKFVYTIRYYAKGKDKKKEKGKMKVQINKSQISEYVNVDTLKNQMQRAIDQLKDDFVKNLSIRSAAGSIEMIRVNLDGKEHTLQELAQIVRKNPKTIVLNMSVFPQAIPAALKAIEKSGMNLNPQQDGTTIYIPVPKVTKEYREGLAKSAKQLFVKCKDSIRDVQIKYVKQVKRKDKISEDTLRSVENQLIAIADNFIAEAEKMLENKKSELIGKD